MIAASLLHLVEMCSGVSPISWHTLDAYGVDEQLLTPFERLELEMSRHHRIDGGIQPRTLLHRIADALGVDGEVQERLRGRASLSAFRDALRDSIA